MRRRYFYWPISGLSFLIVITLWIILRILSGSLEADLYSYSIMVLFAGYLIYFNYPTIRVSLKDLFVSLKARLRSKKAPKEGMHDKLLEQNKLADKYLGDRNSAGHIYEFLKPMRFISDHIIYRILTLIYAAAVTLLVFLLYYYVPPGTETPGDTLLQDLLYASILVSALIAYSSIPRFATLKWKDYPYYLAKSYFALSETEMELAIRLRYFIQGMEAYNLFLQRNLKIKLRNLQGFYSLLSSDKLTVQQEIINNFCLTFHQEKQNHDKLEPFRGIKNMMETYYKMELVTG